MVKNKDNQKRIVFEWTCYLVVSERSEHNSMVVPGG